MIYRLDKIYEKKKKIDNKFYYDAQWKFARGCNLMYICLSKPLQINLFDCITLIKKLHRLSIDRARSMELNELFYNSISPSFLEFFSREIKFHQRTGSKKKVKVDRGIIFNTRPIQIAA